MYSYYLFSYFRLKETVSFFYFMTTNRVVYLRILKKWHLRNSLNLLLLLLSSYAYVHAFELDLKLKTLYEKKKYININKTATRV